MLKRVMHKLFAKTVIKKVHNKRKRGTQLEGGENPTKNPRNWLEKVGHVTNNYLFQHTPKPQLLLQQPNT